MPSLRSSIRRRLEEQQADNPVEQNPVEEAAKEAIQTKLDEQPEPAVEPKPGPMQRWAEKDADAEYADDVNQLELRAADASARIAGHEFGSKAYVAAVEDKIRPQQSTPPRRERGPAPMAPVSRSAPSWSSG